MVPARGWTGGIDIVDEEDAACSVGRGRGGVHAARIDGAEIEAAVNAGAEAVPRPIVLAQQILGAALMAGEEQNMLGADGPEIGHRPVLARASENIAFDKGPQIGPAAQVWRVEQVLGHAPGAEDGPVNIAARQRVVAVVLAPDAGVKDPVGTAVVPGFLQGDDGVAGDFLPIQQQRVGCDSGHIASPGAVVKCDDAVLFGQGAAAVAAPLDARVQGQGHVLPVDQVGTGGVAPVLAPVLGRIGLVKKVVAALPIAEPVGVVERALWIDVVVLGPVRVACQSIPGGAQALQQGIGCQLPLLGGQIGGELAAGHGRGKGFGDRHVGSPIVEIFWVIPGAPGSEVF